MPALIVRRAVWRGALFWIGVRLLFLLVSAVVRSASDPPPPSGLGSHPLVFGLIVAFLAWYDLWRRNEVIFLANLGISRPGAIACYVVPAMLLETMARLVP